MFNLITAVSIIAYAAQVAASPMDSNVLGDRLMYKLNPRMNFFNGCAPVTRYGPDGIIDYSADAAYDSIKNCKSTGGAQIYSRFDAATGWYVYAWYGIVDHPIARAFAYQWQFMGVLPKQGQADSSIDVAQTTAIWTPVDGYRATFKSDGGQHPWVDQYRPNGNTAAGVQTATADKSSQGQTLPVIDVLGDGPFTVKSAGQLKADAACPLSDVSFAHTIETIRQRPFGVGNPKF